MEITPKQNTSPERKVVASGSDIYSDGWRSYDALAVYDYNHKKVKHDENEFARPDGTYINRVESYWSWIKKRLVRTAHFISQTN